MSPNAESVLEAALRLPPGEQQALLSRLLQSVPAESVTLGVEDDNLEAELDIRFADRDGGISWQDLRAED